MSPRPSPSAPGNRPTGVLRRARGLSVTWGAVALLSAAALTCSSAGPNYPGVSYTPYSGAVLPYPPWEEGSWEDLPLVVTDRPVEWSEAHDTIAEIEFEPTSERIIRAQGVPGRSVTRDCRSFEIVVVDSLQPPVWVCRQWDDSPPQTEERRRTVRTDPTLLQRTAWELGGHAVLLPSVTGSPLRGFVIRCPIYRGNPECR